MSRPMIACHRKPPPPVLLLPPPPTATRRPAHQRRTYLILSALVVQQPKARQACRTLHVRCLAWPVLAPTSLGAVTARVGHRRLQVLQMELQTAEVPLTLRRRPGHAQPPHWMILWASSDGTLHLLAAGAACAPQMRAVHLIVQSLAVGACLPVVAPRWAVEAALSQSAASSTFLHSRGAPA